MPRSFTFVMILATFALASLANAQVNKCIDATGKVFYSQTPCPPNTKSSSISPRPAASPASGIASSREDEKAGAKSSGPKTTAELEQEFRKRRTEQEEAAKKEQQKLTDAKTKDENCRSSKMQLASLESGARQARIDEKGERTFLNEAQIASEIERARKAVQNWCK